MVSEAPVDGVAEGLGDAFEVDTMNGGRSSGEFRQW